MALDREDTLKKAETLLRQGRLDAAIAEYLRVADDQPRDWNTANTLGDLYGRAGQSDKAVAQYTRIADHFFHDGFYPKAAALYKKILKITPDDEATQLKLADVFGKQGLLADARSYLTAVGVRRRARGDKRGADDIVVRLGSLDASDIGARMAAARVLAENGEALVAAARFRELYGDLSEKGREAEALDALREAVRLNHGDRQGRVILAKVSLAAGDVERARGYLDRETAQRDPDLLLALAEIELRAGHLDQAREILPQLLAIDEAWRQRVVELGWSLTGVSPEAAFACVEIAVDALIAASDFDHAAACLQEFVIRRPGQVPALLKLVEVCVDGGLESMMYAAQADLTDAYLTAGMADEARVIAEDLVAREPWDATHIDRFRRALVLLGVRSPDAVIADRLSGQAPFMTSDPFGDVMWRPSSTTGTTVDGPKVGPQPAPPVEAIVPPVAPRPRPFEPKPVEFDLTTELGALGPAVFPVLPGGTADDVLEGFREEIARQAAVDQSEQHLKLARTYVGMGLLDEAIAALKTAARSPGERFEAASLLARLLKGRNDILSAIEWFERAAEVPPPSVELGRALLYDLAVTLQEAGESSRALAVCLELQSEAGQYRDLAARVDHLARVQTGH